MAEQKIREMELGCERELMRIYRWTRPGPVVENDDGEDHLYVGGRGGEGGRIG